MAILEQQVIAAVERVYRSIDERRWDDVWESHAGAWRDRCSYDDMVQFLDTTYREGGIKANQLGPFHVNMDTDRADATYTIVWVDDAGQIIRQFDYSLVLQLEDGQWLVEESCYS